METKHTKAPWVFKKSDDVYTIRSGAGFAICEVFNLTLMDKGEFKANAKLIAAAPQMLEALIEAQETIQSLKLSMLAHPDCEEGSEFDDLSSIAEETENLLDLAIKLATE